MQIEHIMQWFETAVPNPTDKNRAVQVGCHFEEAAEMAAALNDPDLAARLYAPADQYKSDESIWFSGISREDLLDALCDQIVTAIGVAHMFGLDIIGAMAEVDRSNWSKFVDGKPVFDANGKIAKPDTYSPPNLEPYV